MISRGISPPTANEHFDCDKLVNKRCSIYKDRPYVCRVFGLTPKMPCLFGCKAERMIAESESMAHMRELGMPDKEDIERYGYAPPL